MSSLVTAENITVGALALGVILSYFFKHELKRNLIVCLYFFFGLNLQYFLRENNLANVWFTVFGTLFACLVFSIFLIKKSTARFTVTDVLLLSIFTAGVLRNLIMHYERYVLNQYSFIETYKESGLVLDTITAIVILLPFIGRALRYLKDRVTNGRYKFHLAKHFIRFSRNH